MQIFRLSTVCIKFHQIPHVTFETTSTFFLNLHNSSISWEITLLYFVSWNFIWFLAKKPIKVQNVRLLTAQVKIHQTCSLIGSSCWKYIKYQLKMYRGFMPHNTEESWKKPIYCFKNEKNLVNFDLSTQKSQKFAIRSVSFMQSIQRLILKSAKELSFMTMKSQNLRKNWLVVWKTTLGIWQIFIRTL